MQALKALGSKAGPIIVFDGAFAFKALVRKLLAGAAIIVTSLCSNANCLVFRWPRRVSVVVHASMSRSQSA